MKKKTESKKVSIEFDERHLSTITIALEVYSRLRSGQIKIAMDTAFYDKELTYNDADVIESIVRTLVFRNEKNLVDNKNSYYGVGCKELKDGTAAWEIKKVIEQYQHYQRNDGYRRTCDVSGNGTMSYSTIPVPKIIDSIHGYWEPKKEFRIPQRYQEKMSVCFKQKKFDKAWDIVDIAFKNKPLPNGTKKTIEEISGTYYVVVSEPYKS